MPRVAGPRARSVYFLRFGVCANALAVADFSALVALEDPRVLPAADAARGPVWRVLLAILITSSRPLHCGRESDVIQVPTPRLVITVQGRTKSPIAYEIGLSASSCHDRHKSSAHRPGPFPGPGRCAACCIGCNAAHFQLQPDVEPHPSQT